MFVGTDVHRNRTQVCVMDKKGNEVSHRNLVNDKKVLARELSGLRRGTPVAFEAAYGTGWIAGLLDELGLEPHLAHPSGCRAIADAKLKYDRVDARTLANLLRTGYLAEAWLAPGEVREQRLLLRERAWLVRLRIAGKNLIRAHWEGLCREEARRPSHGKTRRRRRSTSSVASSGSACARSTRPGAATSPTCTPRRAGFTSQL
jgi:hypothetical protein